MSTYSDRRRLDGRHVVVTGAYGGIGQVLCHRARALGATITAIGRRGSSSDPLWSELDANFIALDVGSARNVIADAVSEIGPLHGLVNLAAVESTADFPDYDDEEFARVLDVNTRGPLHLMQTLRPQMQPEASIVNIITMDALTVLKTTAKSSALYAASKAALATLTRQLAAELGPDGIRVNGVAPGLIDTPMTSTMPDDRRRWIVERTALGRIGQPADIADVTTFLLSDASRFITGQVLPVDGGMAAAMYGPPELAVPS
jgi:NAD(P)-dependent dehydrogenase (short-subunit alcohol dehydrogenase family)